MAWPRSTRTRQATSPTTTCQWTRRVRPSRSHHRTSCAQGPAHAVISPPRRGSASPRNTAGRARRFAAARDRDRSAGPVEQLDRGWRFQHPGRRRARHRARPGGQLPRRLPSRAARVSLGRGADGPGRLGFAWLAPRHPGHPFGGGAATLGYGRHHVLRAQHPLHPGEDAGGPVDRGRVAAPEAELTTACGDHLLGGEAQQGEPAGEAPARGGALAQAAGDPSVELPTDALGQRRRRERPFVTPGPGQVLTVLGLGLDDDLGACEPSRLQAAEEPVGQPLRGERSLVDPLGRGVDLADLDQVRGWHGERGRMLLLPAREPVRADAVGAEAGEDRGRRELGERTEGAQTQAVQHPGQPDVSEDLHRPRREEGWGLASREARRSRGAPRAGPRSRRRRSRRARRRPLRAPMLRAPGRRGRRRRRSSATARGSGTPGPRAGRSPAAGVSCSTARAIGSNVRASAAGIDLHDRDPGAPRFGFASPEPRADLFGARLLGTRPGPGRARAPRPGRRRARRPGAGLRPPASPGTTSSTSGLDRSTLARPLTVAHDRGQPVRARAPTVRTPDGMPRPSTRSRNAAWRKHALAELQPGPGPALGPESQRRVGGPRPRRGAHHHQDGAALPGARDQPARVGGAQTPRGCRP